MSVAVPIEALQEHMDQFAAPAFLITASPSGSAHVVSAAPRVEGNVLRVGAGRTTRSNLAANPVATLLWPCSADGQYSLIVDATAATIAADGDEDDVAVTPTRAVLHRLVSASGTGPSCIPIGS